MSNSGVDKVTKNVREIPRNFMDSLRRRSDLSGMRGKIQAVAANFFLHFQAAKTKTNSLRPSYTMGLGVASLILFLILSGTGFLLMVYYKPSELEAYNSIKDIQYVVPYGWFIRNLHRWSAHLMVITVLLHMVRVFYTGSYKKPREFNWVIGILLLVLTLALSFTGYLLPWDQLGYWAAKIGSNIAGSPSELTDSIGATGLFDIGALQKAMLLGGQEVGQEALIRFYLLHIIILPVALVVLVGLHFWRIRKDGGISRPDEVVTPAGKFIEEMHDTEPSEEPNKTYGLMCIVKDKTAAVWNKAGNLVPSWPYLIRAEVLVSLIVLLGASLLAYYFDAPLKEPANALVPENPAKAPWYFLGLQEMVSYSAFVGGIGIPALVVMALMLIPFLDREEEGVGMWFTDRHGKMLTIKSIFVGALFSSLIVAIPVYFGWIRSWFPDINQMAIILMNPGTVLVGSAFIWVVYVLNRTGSTRMAMIAFFSLLLISFIILTYVGTELRGPNWGFYWSKSDWPIH